MEYKKKKMSYDDIKALEMTKIEEIGQIADEYVGKFADIGYKFVIKMMVLESSDPNYKELDLNVDRDYSSDYVSQYRFTVETPFSDEDLKNMEEIKEENEKIVDSELDETEIDESPVDEETEICEPNDKCETEKTKAKAFLDYFIMRVYKSFFIEYIEVPDDYEQLKSDLEEFYNHFSSEDCE